MKSGCFEFEILCRDKSGKIHQVDPSSLINDLVVERAEGIFEALEAKRDVLFHFKDHYQRMLSSCREASNPAWDERFLIPPEIMEAHIVGLLRTAGRRTAMVKLIVTGGYTKDGITSAGSAKTILKICPLPSPPKNPLNLVCINDDRVLPKIKMTSGYGQSGIYSRQVRSDGYDTFIYSDDEHGIMEEPYANIFFVDDSHSLVTPVSHVLSGITRNVVISLAKQKGITVVETDVHFDDMKYECEEAFLTSTTKRVTAVSSITDNRGRTVKCKLGRDSVTEKIRKAFDNYRKEYFKNHGV